MKKKKGSRTEKRENRRGEKGPNLNPL